MPDGSVGLYSYDEFDDEGAELGPEQIVIVELKSPDVPVGREQKEPCYKYVRELPNPKALHTPRRLRHRFETSITDILVVSDQKDQSHTSRWTHAR